MTRPLRILHTSDWHIGHTIGSCRKKRYEEFEAFLGWLADTIDKEQVDALLVAGDVFDNSTPSNRSQEIYYRFLRRVSDSRCRHVVVTAGNHDSPSFLEAPRELLRYMNVHVIGSPSNSLEDEVLVLKGEDGVEELIICAVPYLRDRDVRVAEAGESLKEKDLNLLAGVRSHYSAVCGLAENKRRSLLHNVPIVAMGHLFVAGGQTVEGDGVRELYVGSISRLAADIFPDYIDYLALGHLHVPQKVNGSEKMRYSGSPLPMGFGESKQQKSVSLVDFSSRHAVVNNIGIPVFQRIERIAGEWDEIRSRLRELSSSRESTWVEVMYDGDISLGELERNLEEFSSENGVEILNIRNMRVMSGIISRLEEGEMLNDLDVEEIFTRLLDANEAPEEKRQDLMRTYREIVQLVQEMDENVE